MLQGPGGRLCVRPAISVDKICYLMSFTFDLQLRRVSVSVLSGGNIQTRLPFNLRQTTQERIFASATLNLTRWPWYKNLTSRFGRRTCTRINGLPTLSKVRAYRQTESVCLYALTVVTRLVVYLIRPNVLPQPHFREWQRVQRSIVWLSTRCTFYCLIIISI